MPSEIFFTSGSTESNNIAIQGLEHYAHESGKNRAFCKLYLTDISLCNVQRVCDNSIVALTLYVKIINGERFYKVNGEHVRQLPYTEYVNGFGYNAVTSSYRLYL